MSKTINNNRQSLETNKENINYPINFPDKKTSQKGKSENSTNQSSLPLNNNTTNLFITKEKETNYNNLDINNNQNNKNDNKEKNDNKDGKYVTINEIIGEKCNINLDILRLFYDKYEQSKTSKKKMGIIESYGVNTYQGIVRHYNEDRVSIIINMNKPKNYNKKWPKISFFGIYDGHGGETCSEYLRDNLHKLICENNEFFPENIPQAIRVGFKKAEDDFLNNYALNAQKEVIDRSGSCAIIILIVDKRIFIANVGDSRCILSMDNGKKYIEVTKDHKPNSPNEIKRIKKYGGSIYQTETVMNNVNNPEMNGKILIGPYRVLPGRLSVSRTIGDAEAKMEKYGGNPNVIISEPEIFFYDLNRDDIDFFILGCDGIYDQLSSNEILDIAWMIIKEKEHPFIKQCKDIHNQSALIVDLIMKSALTRKSFDNVTCLFIALKDLGKKFNKEIDKNEKDIDNNNNIKDIKENKNESTFLIPNISPVVAPDIKDNNFKKINMLEKKLDTSLNNSQYDFINKNNNNRNNSKYYFTDYRNSNKHLKNFKSDYKLRNVRLNKLTADININNNNIIPNTRNKNNIINNNYINTRFSHSRSKDNPMSYASKRYQSYSKIPNYQYNNENMNRKERKNNINLNNTFININTNSLRNVLEGNLNRSSFDNEKIEESPYLNTSNIITHTFKPLLNNNNNGIKTNEYRKTFTSNNNNISNSLYKMNRFNNNIVNLSNLQPNVTSHKYLITVQGGRNTNYVSNTKNNRNINPPYKNQSQTLNNNNVNINNTYSSLSSQNSKFIKSQKNNLSLNNTEIINSKSILRSRENKVLSSRFPKNIRQITLKSNIPNTSFNLNDKIRKVSNSNSNRFLTNIIKNYNNYTHNVNKNTGMNYSNYLITENNDSKKDYLVRPNKMINNANNRSNLQQYKKGIENNIGNSYINYRYNRIQNLNNNENEKNDGTTNRRLKYYYQGY